MARTRYLLFSSLLILAGALLAGIAQFSQGPLVQQRRAAQPATITRVPPASKHDEILQQVDDANAQVRALVKELTERKGTR